MRKPISQERIDLANQVQSLAKQYTSKEVAVITGKSQPYIKSLAQDFGIGFFQPKLDDHDIYLIREVRRRYGLPLAEIAQFQSTRPGRSATCVLMLHCLWNVFQSTRPGRSAT